MSKTKNLIGMRFERLVVIERNGSTDRGKAKWKCKCDCGNITTVSGDNLRRGHIKSCGCLNSELAQKRMSVHGMRYTRLYNIWRNMRYRCNDKDNKDYGGRGISVCKEWDNTDDGFENFLEWSTQNGYDDVLTIDRIDVNGNYEPSNCRWATPKQQGNNKRNNLSIYQDGVFYTPIEFAEKHGISYEKARRIAHSSDEEVEV